MRAAGGGAGVEDRLAGPGGEEIDRVRGGGILDVGVTGIEQGARHRAVEPEKPGEPVDLLGIDHLFGWPERVEAQEGRGRFIVPCHQGGGVRGAELPSPTLA